MIASEIDLYATQRHLRIPSEQPWGNIEKCARERLAYGHDVVRHLTVHDLGRPPCAFNLGGKRCRHSRANGQRETRVGFGCCGFGEGLDILRRPAVIDNECDEGVS
jgi:hypothetical protein